MSIFCSEKQEDTGDEEVAEENEEEDEDGETKEKKDTGQQGPWKGTAAPVAPVPGIVKRKLGQNSFVLDYKLRELQSGPQRVHMPLPSHCIPDQTARR